MNEKEPGLEEFGITPEEYELYTKGESNGWGWLFGVVIVAQACILFLIVFLVTRDLGIAFGWGFFGAVVPPGIFVSGFLGMLAKSLVVGHKRTRLLQSPVASQIELYNKAKLDQYENQRKARQAEREARRAQERVEWARREAELARKRKLRDYWMNLSGIEFERELAALFQRRGYRVQTTPSSGDQGIDLIARKNGKTTIVQCKRYKNPAGPAIARELYGSLTASRADRAILACTGGFTRGVREFVKDKPITLIDAWDIIKVEASIQD